MNVVTAILDTKAKREDIEAAMQSMKDHVTAMETGVMQPSLEKELADMRATLQQKADKSDLVGFALNSATNMGTRCVCVWSGVENMRRSSHWYCWQRHTTAKAVLRCAAVDRALPQLQPTQVGAKVTRPQPTSGSCTCSKYCSTAAPGAGANGFAPSTAYLDL